MLRKSSAGIPAKKMQRTTAPGVPLGSSPSSNLNPFAPAFHASPEPELEPGREEAVPAQIELPSVSHTEWVLAWDIEKSGPRTDKHSMLALGAVVVRVADDWVPPDGEFRVFMKMEQGHDYSAVCRREYWYNWDDYPNNRNVLKAIDMFGMDPAEGIRQFAEWLDAQERKYGKALALATDNPASDARWVSHYFQKYLNRNPIIHPFGDERRYRRLHHSNAFARAISLDDGSGGKWCDRLRQRGIRVPPESLHDHDPLNDARWIALLYTACLRYTSKWRTLWDDMQKERVADDANKPVSLDPARVAKNGGFKKVTDLEASTIPFWLRTHDRLHQQTRVVAPSPLRYCNVIHKSHSI